MVLRWHTVHCSLAEGEARGPGIAAQADLQRPAALLPWHLQHTTLLTGVRVGVTFPRGEVGTLANVNQINEFDIFFKKICLALSAFLADPTGGGGTSLEKRDTQKHTKKTQEAQKNASGI